MSSAKAALSVVVDHGVAAVLDDDERAAELLEPGQRLDEGLRPCPVATRSAAASRWPRTGFGVAHVLYAEFSWT